MDTLAKRGYPAGAGHAFYGDGDGFFRADEHHQFSAAGYGGVEQVSLEHHVVLRVDGHYHHGVLAALALVDGLVKNGSELFYLMI